jgi:hypothetical protein
LWSWSHSPDYVYGTEEIPVAVLVIETFQIARQRLEAMQLDGGAVVLKGVFKSDFVEVESDTANNGSTDDVDCLQALNCRKVIAPGFGCVV